MCQDQPSPWKGHADIDKSWDTQEFLGVVVVIPMASWLVSDWSRAETKRIQCL